MPWEPSTKQEIEAVAAFRAVGQELHAIDPEHVENWMSLALGFFLGRGLPLPAARLAARKVGHNYEFFTGGAER